MAGYRVLDIETVVDDRFWTRPPAKWSQRPVDGAYLMTPGGDQIHRDHSSLFEISSEWVKEDPFPPPQAHRVVAISWVDLSGDDNEWYKLLSGETLCRWSHDVAEADHIETHLLTTFGEAQEKDLATLVTWNGRVFDLPVINLRSFRHGLPCPWYYGERDVRYRYSEAGHCDLMDVFSDHGAARHMKLGDVARLVGLPGKVGPVSGASIGQIYAGGDDQDAMNDVAKYCLSDSLQTAYLFACSRVHKGMISREYFDAVVKPSFFTALFENMNVKPESLR